MGLGWQVEGRLVCELRGSCRRGGHHTNVSRQQKGITPATAAAMRGAMLW